MSRIYLDFTSPGSHPGPLSWLLLALGLLAAVVAVFDWQVAEVGVDDARSQLAASKPVVKQVHALKRPDDEARQDAAARRALALPWRRLLSTLQDIQADDVAYLQFDADGQRGDFQLTADAKSYPAMLDYFSTVQALPAFHSVVLTRHQLQEIDGVQGVNFSLHGVWTRP